MNGDERMPCKIQTVRSESGEDTSIVVEIMIGTTTAFPPAENEIHEYDRSMRLLLRE